jgi:hypothetical protein
MDIAMAEREHSKRVTSTRDVEPDHSAGGLPSPRNLTMPEPDSAEQDILEASKKPDQRSRFHP